MKKIHKVFTLIMIIALIAGSFILGRESAIHQPHQVIESTSDGASDSTLLPLDSLHRIGCQSRYILIK